MGLEGVGFDDEESVVVEGGYLCGFPCEEVDVGVSAPLGDDDGSTTLAHEETVEDDDNGPVGLRGTAADVDDDEVTVGDCLVGVDLGESPDPELALGIGNETEISESLLAFMAVGGELTDELGRPAELPEGLDAILVEYLCAGVDESLDIVGGEL